MPNFCENNLRVRGDQKEIREFSEKTKTKKLSFTFEKLVPTPASFLKDGSDKWYNWRIKNWGTKWDVDTDSVSRDEDEDFIEVSFDTAWAPPLEWLVKVSKKFKKLLFRIHYREDGAGFEGVAKVTKGKLEDKYINF